MTWILRTLFILFAAALSFQMFPLSLDPPELRGAALAAVLAAAGLLLEFLGRRVDVRVLAGAMAGLACGAGAGALLWRVVPADGVLNLPAEFLRTGQLLVWLYLGAVLGARKAEHFTLDSLRAGGSRRTAPANKILDTSVIIDGRIADLIDANFLEGLIVVPRFVLRELQQVADSNDPIKRARGRRGLEMLNRLQRSTRVEVKIHDGDFPDEKEVDAKLIRLARNLRAKLYTNDYNLGKIAELQSVSYVNLHEVAKSLKIILLPGELLTLRIAREGKDRGQGVGYLPDGTMVVVNNAQSLVGHQVEAQVQSLLQTGAGIIVFADVKTPPAPAPQAAASAS